MGVDICYHGIGPDLNPHCRDCEAPMRWCQCVLLERTAGAERDAARAISEANSYRELWECAASCISHNAAKIKPRGGDEARMVELAKKDMHGHFWSGETDGWI